MPSSWLPWVSIAWLRRDMPTFHPFPAISVFAGLLLGTALGTAAVTLTTIITWYKFLFLMLVLALTGVTCFSLEHVRPGRWLIPGNLIIPSIPLLLTLLVILVDDARLMWQLMRVAPHRFIALFGFRIFDPLPTAYQAVIEHMHADVVEFAARWRVVSLNPATEKMQHAVGAAPRALVAYPEPDQRAS